MSVKASEYYRIYDNFLLPEEAQGIEEALRVNELPNHNTGNSSDSDSSPILHGPQEKLLISRVEELFNSENTVPFPDIFPFNNIDGEKGITIVVTNHQNANGTDGPTPESVKASFYYYPIVLWEPRWGGEIFIKSEEMDGFGTFVSPKPNRLVIIKSGVEVEVKNPEKIRGSIWSLITVDGMILGRAS